MTKGVEDFVYSLITDVFNSRDTAPLAIRAILEKGSFDLGPKVGRIEDPRKWTDAKIRERGASLKRDRGPKGDFAD
jgi:fructose-bisphosphate aldolase class II